MHARGSDGITCLPHTFGVQAARPDTLVVPLTGDGGLGYRIADLETAVREAFPVTVVVRRFSGDPTTFGVSENLLTAPYQGTRLTHANVRSPMYLFAWENVKSETNVHQPDQ